jgi:tRNA-Thr(GGU) m(6)t(6)A37 methyltransferase TsaA
VQLRQIGAIDSPLSSLEDAPRQGDEGGPDAWLVVAEEFVAALEGLGVGDRIVVLTWLDRAPRDVLRTRPRDDPNRPERGVFATRSPARPNPVGMHEVEILDISGPRLRVNHMDAVDGTPVIDIKPVLRLVDRR